MKWFNKNFFFYGETGTKLNGVRESEVYDNSADTIKNMYITETGNLQVARKFDGDLVISDRKVLYTFDTSHDHYIICTERYIQTRKYSDDSLIEEEDLGASYPNLRANYFENILLIHDNFSLTVTKEGFIFTNNFYDTIIPPLTDKRTYEFDIYKVYDDGGTAKAFLMGKYSDKELFFDYQSQSSIYAIGHLYFNDERIYRIYNQYSVSPVGFDITLAEVGQLFMVPDVSSVSENEKTFFGKYVSVVLSDFTDTVFDSLYHKEIALENAPTENYNGTFRFGTESISNLSESKNSIIFQNRLFMILGDTIYASALFDYTNFLNGTVSADAFYLKPSTVNNKQPELYDFISGNGLFITSNTGVHVLGYDTQLTPSTSINSLIVASDDPVKEFSNLTLVKNNFYYNAEDGTLKCIQPSYNTGQLEFLNSIVEKYDFEFNTKSDELDISHTKFTLDGKKRLVVSAGGTRNSLYIYDRVDYNVFRRYTLELATAISPVKINTVRDRLIITDDTNTSVYSLSDLNYSEVILKVHTPNLKTKTGGSYLNDYYSTLKKIAINMINEDRQGISKLYVNGREVPLLAVSADDLFNIFKADLNYQMMNGIEIKIETNSNDKLVEIKGVDMLIDIKGDV